MEIKYGFIHYNSIFLTLSPFPLPPLKKALSPFRGLKPPHKEGL
jgi:hypothetical protein